MAPASATARVRFAPVEGAAQIFTEHFCVYLCKVHDDFTPRVHALTAEAEHLLTLRETHRLNGIPAVPFEPAP